MIKLFRLLVTLAYAGVLFYLFSFPFPETPPLFRHADKVFHFGLYFPMGFLAVWTLRLTRFRYSPRLLWIAFIATLLYGLFTELNQMLIPERDADLLDLCANIIGGFLGVSFAAWLIRQMKHEHFSWSLRKRNSC